jgi:hypothetical protein
MSAQTIPLSANARPAAAGSNNNGAQPGSSETGWHTVAPLDEVRGLLNREAFRVAHSLAGNPLFQLDALIEVAKQASTRPGDLYLDAGDVSVHDKWGNIPIPDRPVDEIIRRIESAGAWIIIKHVEQGPGYDQVIREFDEFVREVAGRETAQLLSKPEMLVLVTSPNRVTPFHFDAEVNFLVQIQGEKDAWVCDPNDRSAVTDLEIERYYSVNHNSGTFKPGLEERARLFHLKPGEGVHIPTHAGHWVKNGNAVSVSLSLNFELPSSMYRDVYRMNHHLRRLGLEPTPPGRAPLRDKMKVGAARFSRKLNRWRGR